jgi:murein DD-endopeptidase MepM/ murein hydrolase activator NlpD
MCGGRDHQQMPSQTTNSHSSGSGSTTIRSTLNKREARAARRAAERQRRARIFQFSLGIIVVIAVVILFVTHNPLAQLGKSSVAKKAGSACPAPTATPIGPVPAPKPPQSPPKVSGTTVNGSQGLQYIDVKVGCGTAVKAGNTVTVIYHGWLQSNGKLFDSSYLHGLTYQVQNIGQAQVISGWNIGLIGMKVGGTRRLIIPPALGYGTQGSPPTIPANATLIFDITLVSIDS